MRPNSQPSMPNRRYLMAPKLEKPAEFKPPKPVTGMKQPPTVARIQKQETPKGINVSQVAKTGAALIKAAPKLSIRRIN